MEQLQSLFIDDELGLDEKIHFVQTVNGDSGFSKETVRLLEQEKRIRGRVTIHVPDVLVPRKGQIFGRMWRPVALGLPAIAAVVLVFILWSSPKTTSDHRHRFVLFEPDATSVEITGSFTGWSRIPMAPAGNSGYWQVTLELPQADHRYAYILDGRKRIHDPTVLRLEQDDFGGTNSILLKGIAS
ncbi:MAG: glycogen-binding domain-containing protein [Desulfatiglans sp.]|jgi:hypothetical protein|nr:glycogen-binding domain-containing protein [Thermodesulfobacteriota bacterium]MEE4353234.1 glycogen-binding domain-containing protein [Desulfatiglans sp.]